MRPYMLGVLLCMTVMFATACRGVGKTETKETGEEAVYTSDYRNLCTGEERSGATFFREDTLYYIAVAGDGSKSIQTRNLDEWDVCEALPVVFDDNIYVDCFTVSPEGNVYTIESLYSSEEGAPDGIFLRKYDAGGAPAYSVELISLLQKEEGLYIQAMSQDKEGRLYLCADDRVYFLREDGSPAGSEALGGWIACSGTDEDGRFWCGVYGANGIELAAPEFGGGKSEGPEKAVCKEDINGMSVFTPAEDGFLFCDKTALYAYDAGKGKSRRILDWISCDIAGRDVRGAWLLEDGRYAILVDESEIGGLVLLCRDDTGKAQKKQEIVLGTLFPDSALQAQAVWYNRQSDTTRVRIKNYTESYPESGEELQKAIEAMQLELTSGNGPDLVNLQYQEMTEQLKAYVDKGVLEDLSPWLEKSERLNREGLAEPLLAGYTFGDTLACMPMGFAIGTLLAKGSEAGENAGWTPEEVMALADRYPEKELLFDATAGGVLMDYLSCNMDFLVDREKGICRFQSPEFQTMLEHAGRYPVTGTESMEASPQTRMMSGGQLIYEAYWMDPESITSDFSILGKDIVAKGYPTISGEERHLLFPVGGVYGMTAASQHKAEAWDFVESLLAGDGGSEQGMRGFSVRKDLFEKSLREACAEPYEKDEEGNVKQNEDGSPKRQEIGMVGWYEGDREVSFAMYACLPEEMELLKRCADKAALPEDGGDQIASIVAEEADAYFAGQKSAEEVIHIIQNRADIYLNEQK